MTKSRPHRPEQSTIRLSICIPTHNFGRFIGEALDSLLVQLAAEVEIVVLDSASTDDTETVVHERQRNHACLRYVRAENKRGIDRDMASVVALAHGEYVWLFSADDVAVPHAVARLLEETKKGCDVYICMHSNETLSMQPIRASHPVLNLHESATFQLSDPAQQLTYFSLAATTEGFFSYMSGLIVKRSIWNSVDLNEMFVGTCWSHVARLFELMPRGLSVRFLSEVLVRRRGDNDSFATHGLVRRYALAIQGFLKLAGHFWGDGSPQAFHIRRVLRREFPFRSFWAMKHRCAENPDTEDIRLLDSLMADAYADNTLASLSSRFAYRVFPAALFMPALSTVKFLRRMVARIHR